MPCLVISGDDGIVFGPASPTAIAPMLLKHSGPAELPPFWEYDLTLRPVLNCSNQVTSSLSLRACPGHPGVPGGFIPAACRKSAKQAGEHACRFRRLSENGPSAGSMLLSPNHPFCKLAGISDQFTRRLPCISGRLPGFGCRDVEGPGVAFGWVKR